MTTFLYKDLPFRVSFRPVSAETGSNIFFGVEKDGTVLWPICPADATNQLPIGVQIEPTITDGVSNGEMRMVVQQDGVLLLGECVGGTASNLGLPYDDGAVAGYLNVVTTAPT